MENKCLYYKKNQVCTVYKCPLRARDGGCKTEGVLTSDRLSQAPVRNYTIEDSLGGGK